MKKIFLFALFTIAFYSTQAQVKSQQPLRKHILSPSVRAYGDTLMYMYLPDIYINPVDLPTFQTVTEDMDGLTPSGIWSPTFGLYYSANSSLNSLGQPLQSNFYHPWEVPPPTGTDTSFFWAATSSFSPAGIADNWLMFGPLTIPPTGATLYWYDKTNSGKDGYEVRVSNLISTPILYSDFVDSAIYSEADDDAPSASYASDTVWELKSVIIPSVYNGQQIAFAFHHNANDMSYLYLDEITLTEGAANCDADFSIVQDTANPFNYFVYNNSSTGSAYTYLWDFGDSTTSTLQYPTHTYSWSGPFHLCLTVQDSSGCVDTYCDSLNAGHASVGLTLTVVPLIITGVAEIKNTSVLSVYPNPASTNTTISYNIGKDAIIELSVLDLIGNKVAAIDAGRKQAGNHQSGWNTESLSEGMYLIQLRSGENVLTQKFIITR